MTGGRAWRLLLALCALSLVGAGALLAPKAFHQGVDDIAPSAQVTASSTQVGASARDVVTSGAASSPGAQWVSDHETVGAWLQLAWPITHHLHEVTLVRNPLEEPGITSGYLSFDDGSRLSFPLSPTSRVTTIAFTPRSVAWMRFTVTTVSPSAPDVAVSEVLVSDQADPGRRLSPVTTDDIASTAERSSSSSDGTLAATPGAWIEYTFPQLQEVASVELVGGAGASARLRSARLSFSDGSSVPVGAVTVSQGQPTILGFMPRVVHTVRLTVSTATGTGPLDLAAWRVYQAGATPSRPVPTAGSVGGPAPTPPCTERAGGGAQLLVLCPTPGSASGSSLTVSVWVPTAAGVVDASAWSDLGAGAPLIRGSGRAGAGGVATVKLDVSSLPPGPFTVRLSTTPPSGSEQKVDLVLYRPSSAPVAPVARLPGDRGRTLVYDEEFTAALSISRTGRDSLYSASKPTDGGVEDFGDAIFADPQGPDRTIDSIDGSYVRLTARGTTQPDPAGFGRRYVGAMLASARSGGSGVSAQYGYFEARMAVSSAEGTWPAFWLLPTQNLVEPQDVVPEIDAVELYGHSPTGACAATHEREAEEDKGVSHCGTRFADDHSPSLWHTYAVDVAPTGITFLIDGRAVASAPQVRGGGDPLFFLLDLALGGGWPVDMDTTGGAAVVFVDHIRVYV